MNYYDFFKFAEEFWSASAKVLSHDFSFSWALPRNLESASVKVLSHDLVFPERNKHIVWNSVSVLCGNHELNLSKKINYQKPHEMSTNGCRRDQGRLALATEKLRTWVTTVIHYIAFSTRVQI